MSYEVKVLEKIVQRRLCSFPEKPNILLKTHYCFWNGLSRQDDILYLLTKVSLALVKRLPIPCIFVDLPKAFDLVSYPMLLEALKNWINVETRQLVGRYLSERKQSRKIRSQTSCSRTIRYGGIGTLQYLLDRNV